MNYWNTVITPTDRLLTIDWKEIWRYRDMYSLFVVRSFKTAYKQTVLGSLWFIITPVIEAFKYGAFGAGQFSWTDLGYSAGCMMVLLVVGMLMFTRKQKAFIDTI